VQPVRLAGRAIVGQLPAMLANGRRRRDVKRLRSETSFRMGGRGLEGSLLQSNATLHCCGVRWPVRTDVETFVRCGLIVDWRPKQHGSHPPHGTPIQWESCLFAEVEVTLVCQYVLVSSPLWDSRPDINSVWTLLSCLYGAPSLTRGRVCLLFFFCKIEIKRWSRPWA
jgi:hypothetical protein